MTSALQNAGAATPPSDFAPLHTNRMFTGYYTNRSPLRNGATSEAQEKYGYGRQDSIWDGSNTEISTRLTLIRRPGNNVYNTNPFAPAISFYSFNTFTLTSESIMVLMDTAAEVIDVTGIIDGGPNNAVSIFTKSTGAGRTYFCSIGNLLYFTNGVDSKIYNKDTGVVSDWGIDAPTDAPTVAQSAKPTVYPGWQASTVFSGDVPFSVGIGVTPSGGGTQLVAVTTFGTTGSAEPTWPPYTDGSVVWGGVGGFFWVAGGSYGVGNAVIGTVAGVDHFFYCVVGGIAAASGPPDWVLGPGTLTPDGTVTWQDYGVLLHWSDIGPGTLIVDSPSIIDSNGYIQTIVTPGKTAATPPAAWATTPGDYTTETTGVVWINAGPFSPAATAPVQYGYAYKNSVLPDVSDMSPASVPITFLKGGQIAVQGVGSGQAGVDTIPIYRTAQGGSTFLGLDEIPNPGAGIIWTYIDANTPDSALNTEIQAQVGGEGTPLPEGAGPIEYHLDRLFVGVGNVVYVATGPDAIVSGSSGQAGFDTTFTAQSKIIRFWVTPLGLVVFTVRDSYIILGSATDADPLYMLKFIARLPLLSYDCMTEQHTTAFLFLGTRMIVALDPSSGIMEVSFQISNIIKHYDPKSSYLTYHTEASEENALYLSDGISKWNRMAPTSAPESGANWSVSAVTVNGFSAVQSVEVVPGEWRLLLGPSIPALGPLPILHVQSNAANSITNVVSTPFTSPNTAHNCLIIVANWQFPIFPAAWSISDTLGNTYGTPLTILQNATYYNIWVIPDCLGGANTVTLNYPGFSTSVAILAVHEYQNVATATPIDATNIYIPGSTIPTTYTPAVTTTTAQDILFIFAGNGSTSGSFNQTGYTVRQDVGVTNGIGNRQQLVTMDAIAAAPGTYAQTITLPGATIGEPAALMLALKAKIGPVGPLGDQHIRFRDLTTNLDDGSPYAAFTTFGSIVLASPSQLAAIAFITLDSEATGTPAALSVLMNEIDRSGGSAGFESVKRTRQDPPLLPPSKSYISDRFSLLKNQQPVWCRHFMMRIDWPAEDAANELVGFTIVGQMWQEFRSQ